MLLSIVIERGYLAIFVLRLYEPDGKTNLVVNLVKKVWVLTQELLGGLPALAEALLLVGVPGPRLVYDVLLDGHVEDRALLRDARAVHDVELGGLKGRRDLVLDDLDAHAVADDLVALLD